MPELRYYRVKTCVTKDCTFENGSADNQASIEMLAYAKDEADAVLDVKDETIRKLRDSADLKDACIKRMTEKITTLEKNLWDLQRKPHTDCGSQVERFQEENKALKLKLKEVTEKLQAFQKRYNDA